MNKLDVGAVPPIRFIEFMGLPGSGKSTIAAHLEIDLKQLGINAISRSTEPTMLPLCSGIVSASCVSCEMSTSAGVSISTP